jgi:hypothetical protein
MEHGGRRKEMKRKERKEMKRKERKRKEMSGYINGAKTE